MLARQHSPSVALKAEYAYDRGFRGCWRKKGRHLGRGFLHSRSWGHQQTLAHGLTELLRKTKVMGNLGFVRQAMRTQQTARKKTLFQEHGCLWQILAGDCTLSP